MPADGSPDAEALVDRAISFAESGRSRIHGLYVVDHRALMPLQEAQQRSIAESRRSTCESAVEGVSRVAADRDLDVETFVAQGVPAHQILAYAEQHDVDAIVIGSHGQSMRNQAIGRTAERVVQGINDPPETTVVVVLVGDEAERERRERALSEGVRGMFQ
ncbi:MAG: universal stress protein [Halobacteriales archaeon]